MKKRITQKVIKKTKEIIKNKFDKENEKEDSRDNKRNHNPKEILDNFPKSKLRAY